MRQLGWLHATPEGSKKARIKSFMEADEDHHLLKLPEVDGAEYIVAFFYEAGMCLHTGMGATPLTWQEIDSWLRATQLDITPWEKLLIREMSEAYVSEHSAASAKDREAPYTPPVEEIDRAAVSEKLKNVFRTLKRPTQHEN